MSTLKSRIDEIFNTKDIENIESILSYGNLGSKILNVLREVRDSSSVLSDRVIIDTYNIPLLIDSDDGVTMQVKLDRTLGSTLDEDMITGMRKSLSYRGYFTKSLFHISAVKSKFECTDEQAMEVLNQALNEELIVNQVQFGIEVAAEFMGLNRIESKSFLIDGYFKDDPNNKFEKYLVVSSEDVPDGMEDEDIFYHGLSELQIQNAIKSGEVTELEFVITSYSKQD